MRSTCISRRRAVLRLAASALAPAAAVGLRAESYPVRPIRVVVPFAPGGAPDILARLFAQEMSLALGNTFVENRPGAGGNVGADSVAKAAHDGYTLLMTTTATQSINPALYASMPYDSIKDFTPISLIANTPLMLATAQPALKSVADVVAAARKAPGTLTFGSSGIGTMQHMAGELLQDEAKVSMTHIPYKGTSLILPDLMAGRVDIMFNSVAAFAPFLKDGKLRALAVTSKKRLPGWPDVPTVAESGYPDYEASAWYALFGPAQLPADVVNRLARESARIVDLSTTRQRYAQLGLEPAHSTPGELDATVKRDLAKWARIIQTKHIHAE